MSHLARLRSEISWTADHVWVANFAITFVIPASAPLALKLYTLLLMKAISLLVLNKGILRIEQEQATWKEDEMYKLERMERVSKKWMMRTMTPRWYEKTRAFHPGNAGPYR